jgi:TonB family protein
MMVRSCLVACLSLIFVPVLSLASITPSVFRRINHGTRPIYGITTGTIHIVKYALLEEADIEMQCGSIQPPRALATPHPSLADIPDDVKIIVNFIIGTDGQVYSPFVLEGAGPSFERKIMETVRRWRYRPALCNGVPTDAEVRVQLSSK